MLEKERRLASTASWPRIRTRWTRRCNAKLLTRTATRFRTVPTHLYFNLKWSLCVPVTRDNTERSRTFTISSCLNLDGLLSGLQSDTL